MVILPIYKGGDYGYVILKGGVRMSSASSENPTLGNMIVQIKGKLSASSAIHIGTVLDEAINNGIKHLTLDFGAVSYFDYSGITLLVAVLDFYGRDFSTMICCRFPQDISNTLKGLGAESIPGVEIMSTNDPKRVGVGDLQFVSPSNLN
jgi:anti-anti-sigma regulatory factor